MRIDRDAFVASVLAVAGGLVLLAWTTFRIAAGAWPLPSDPGELGVG
jgi:hypothetical protein